MKKMCFQKRLKSTEVGLTQSRKIPASQKSDRLQRIGRIY